MVELILGGARSGKSRLAEERAGSRALEVIYIATAEAGSSARDPEMTERIRHHQQQRPAHWQTIEEPLYLAQHLQALASTERMILVDCLTLWLTNLLAGEVIDEERFEQERTQLIEILPELPGEIILVSNEVGLGIVPMGELSRRFCDESGRLNQQVAAVCDRVTLMVAGLPMVLKGKE